MDLITANTGLNKNNILELKQDLQECLIALRKTNNIQNRQLYNNIINKHFDIYVNLEHNPKKYLFYI